MAEKVKKAEKSGPLAKALRMAVETGKVKFGSRSSVKRALMGKAKLIIVSGNCPADVKADISRYASLSEVDVLDFPGTSIELGSVCKKPFGVAVLAVYEPGTSNILEFAKKK